MATDGRWCWSHAEALEPRLKPRSKNLGRTNRVCDVSQHVDKDVFHNANRGISGDSSSRFFPSSGSKHRANATRQPARKTVGPDVACNKMRACTPTPHTPHRASRPSWRLTLPFCCTSKAETGSPGEASEQRLGTQVLTSPCKSLLQLPASPQQFEPIQLRRLLHADAWEEPSCFAAAVKGGTLFTDTEALADTWSPNREEDVILTLVDDDNAPSDGQVDSSIGCDSSETWSTSFRTEVSKESTTISNEMRQYGRDPHNVSPERHDICPLTRTFVSPERHACRPSGAKGSSPDRRDIGPPVGKVLSPERHACHPPLEKGASPERRGTCPLNGKTVSPERHTCRAGFEKSSSPNREGCPVVGKGVLEHSPSYSPKVSPMSRKSKGKGKGPKPPVVHNNRMNTSPSKASSVSETSTQQNKKLPGWLGPRPPPALKAQAVINWQPVRSLSRWRGSVWQRINDEMSEGFESLPTDLLNRAFMKNVSTTPKKIIRAPSTVKRHLSRQNALTADLLHAQLLRSGISSPRQLGWAIGGVNDSSDDMSVDVLTDETLETLLGLLRVATGERYPEPCGGRNAAGVTLAPAEDFLRRLQSCGPLSQLQARVELVQRVSRFESEAIALEKQINAMLEASHRILISTALPTLLQGVLQIGNYVNASSRSLAGAVCVTLESLAKLAHTRCLAAEPLRKDQSTREQGNALLLLVWHEDTKTPGFLEALTSDVAACAKARDVDPKLLAEELCRMEGFVKLIEERCHNTFSNGPLALHPERLHQFLLVAQSRVQQVRGRLSKLDSCLERVRRYFGEPPDSNACDIFQSLAVLWDALPHPVGLRRPHCGSQATDGIRYGQKRRPRSVPPKLQASELSLRTVARRSSSAPADATRTMSTHAVMAVSTPAKSSRGLHSRDSTSPAQISKHDVRLRRQAASRSLRTPGGHAAESRRHATSIQRQGHRSSWPGPSRSVTSPKWSNTGKQALPTHASSLVSPLMTPHKRTPQQADYQQTARAQASPQRLSVQPKQLFASSPKANVGTSQVTPIRSPVATPPKKESALARLPPPPKTTTESLASVPSASKAPAMQSPIAPTPPPLCSSAPEVTPPPCTGNSRVASAFAQGNASRFKPISRQLQALDTRR